METNQLITLEQAARDAKAMQSNRRSRCIRIYLTTAEAKDVLAACQGIPASIYCRAKVLGQSVPRPRRQIPALNRQYYTELARLGLNLNQLAQGVNQAITTGQALPLTEQYLTYLQDIKEMLHRHSLAVMKLVSETETTEKAETNADSHQESKGSANDADR